MNTRAECLPYRWLSWPTQRCRISRTVVPLRSLWSFETINVKVNKKGNRAELYILRREFHRQTLGWELMVSKWLSMDSNQRMSAVFDRMCLTYRVFHIWGHWVSPWQWCYWVWIQCHWGCRWCQWATTMWWSATKKWTSRWVGCQPKSDAEENGWKWWRRARVRSVRWVNGEGIESCNQLFNYSTRLDSTRVLNTCWAHISFVTLWVTEWLNQWIGCDHRLVASNHLSTLTLTERWVTAHHFTTAYHLMRLLRIDWQLMVDLSVRVRLESHRLRLRDNRRPND